MPYDEMNGDPADAGPFFTGVWWRDVLLFAIVTMPIWWLGWAWIGRIREERDHWRWYAKNLLARQDAARGREPPESSQPNS